MWSCWGSTCRWAPASTTLLPPTPPSRRTPPSSTSSPTTPCRRSSSAWWARRMFQWRFSLAAGGKKIQVHVIFVILVVSELPPTPHAGTTVPLPAATATFALPPQPPALLPVSTSGKGTCRKKDFVWRMQMIVSWVSCYLRWWAKGWI